MRPEPVILLPLVQHDLQGGDSHREERESDVVKGGDPLCPQASHIRRILHQGINQRQRKDPHGYVDVEDPAPRIAVGNPSAQRRTNGRCANGSDSVECEG